MDRYDVLTLLGMALLSAGFYFVYEPLVLIVPGVVLFIFGIVAGRGRT